MVEPPTVVYAASTGAISDEIVSAPTPGFGLKWSLNEEDPVVRANSDFGLVEGRDYVRGICCKNLITYIFFDFKTFISLSQVSFF